MPKLDFSKSSQICQKRSSTRAAGTSSNQNSPRSRLLAVDPGPPLHPCPSSFISNIPLGDLCKKHFCMEKKHKKPALLGCSPARESYRRTELSCPAVSEHHKHPSRS